MPLTLRVRKEPPPAVPLTAASAPAVEDVPPLPSLVLDAKVRNRIQGTVVLEAVVSGDGCTSQIRVVKSLDRGGLDDEAVLAVTQRRFEPGRLADAPVDVLGSFFAPARKSFQVPRGPSSKIAALPRLSIGTRVAV